MKLYEYILRAKDEFSATFQKLASIAGSSESRVDAVDRKIRRAAASTRELDSAITFLDRKLKQAFAIGTFITLSTGILKAGSSMEQINIAFETFIGDAELARAKVAELQKFADVSPFSTSEVFEAGQSLMGFGLEAKELIPVMNLLGDASKGNAAKFSALVDNYGKMISAQRANTMDLNQFAIAGVPVWKELSRLTGLSGKELRKWVEINGVDLNTINQIFKNLTGQGGLFFGMMAKQSKSTAGLWSTFVSRLEALAVKIFNAFQPLINILIVFGTKLLNNTAVLKTVGITVGVLGAVFLAYRSTVLSTQLAIAAYTGVVTFARLATILFTGGIGKLNMVLALNPIGLVVTAVLALAAGFIYAYNTSDKFRGAIWGIGEVFKTVFANITNIFKKTFEPITEAMNTFMNPNLSGWEKTKGIAKNMAQLGFNMTPGGLAYNTYKETSKTDYKGAFNKGFENGKKAEGFNMPSWANSFLGGGSGSTQAAANSDSSTSSSKTADGIEAITSGGSKMINVYVNGTKFADKLELNVTKLDEGLSDVENKFREMLVRVCNGAIYAGTQ